MTPEEVTLWRAVLVAGVILVVAVIGLLSLLVVVVRTIDRNVVQLWTDTKLLATNTTGLYQLAGTGSIIRALREELLRHEKLLGAGR
ncbi:MAG TPA: hypothetical protein VG474_10195 [Solirubrobacteraceae bacterium]|nr:hypothetical protein [Solirubrobacteraceae bacterium]